MQDIRVGIVGSGFGTRVILPCFQAAKGSKVVALVSRTPKKIEGLAREYKVPQVFDSLDAMLKIDGLDLVCVAVPPFLHREMVEKAIAVGKHVLCEKPLALNVAEAEQICACAKKSGRLHMIDHQLRFQPNIRKIKSILDSGTLGTVGRVEISYLTATRVDPTTPWDWWSDEQAGGGQLNALGSHYIDMLRWWFGEIVSAQGHIKTVIPQRKSVEDGKTRDVTSDEYAELHLELEGGMCASVVVSTVVADEPGIRIRVEGQNGSLVLDGFDRLLLSKKMGSPEDVSESDPLIKEPIVGINTWRRSLVRLAEHFVECIRNGRQTEGATFSDGLETQLVLDAIRQSHKEGRRVSLSEIKA